MKTAILCLLSLAFSVLIPTLALAGGSGTVGGGDAETSTTEQVHQALSSIPAYTYQFWGYEYQLHLITPENITDPDLRAAVLRIFGEPKASSQSDSTPERIEFNKRMREFVNDPSLISPLEKGVCHGDSAEDDTDASTLHKRGAPICFSVERLTRIPPEVLQAEIIALFFHELAHQYEYDEPVARKIQLLVRRRLQIVPIALAIDELLNRKITFQQQQGVVVNDGHYHYEAVCAQIGYIAGQMEGLNLKPGFDLRVSDEEMVILKKYNPVLAQEAASSSSRLPTAALARDFASTACYANVDTLYLSLGLRIIRSVLDHQ